MKTLLHLQTAGANYALVRIGVALLALASLELGFSTVGGSLANNPVTLGFALFALGMLGIHQLAPVSAGKWTHLESLADAIFIGSAVMLEGCIPLLAASPLLLMVGVWSMSREQHGLAASYHALALAFAWIGSGWHLSTMLQLGATVYIGAIFAYSLHLSRKFSQPAAEDTGVEVLIDVPTPGAELAPELLYNPEPSEKPDQRRSPRQCVHLLRGSIKGNDDIEKIMHGWGTDLLGSNEIAGFLATAFDSVREGDAPDALVIDIRGRREDPVDLLTLVRDSTQLRPLHCILITDDEARPGQTEQLGYEGYDAVLYAPLDKTLLFNALHGNTSLAAQSGVTSLLDRYIRERNSLPPLEILVAIGNQVQLKVVKRQLERSGHHVYTTSSGEQALDAMTAHCFDVAMLDLHLPDMDGIEVTRIYRLTHSRELSSPIIMLASDLDVETQQRCDHAGADSVLGLPAPTDLLNATLGQLVNQGGIANKPNLLSNTTAWVEQQGLISELDHHVLRELERLGNGLPFVQELIDSFIADSNALINTMRTAVDERDLETFCDCAHALKGSAGSVGAVHLQHFCIQLAAINMNDFRNNANVLVPGLLENLHAAHDALLGYLDKRTEQSSRN